MFYIIENNILDADINIIFYSEDKIEINNFIVDYMVKKNCIPISSELNITKEIYNKDPGIYYQYKSNNHQYSQTNENYNEEDDNKNKITKTNNYDSIVIYERMSSYLPFVNSYRLTNTLYIKEYTPSNSLNNYNDSNESIEEKKLKYAKNKGHNLFGQISSFNVNSLKSNKLRDSSASNTDLNTHKNKQQSKTFLDELRNNVLFNSRRALICYDNSNSDINDNINNDINNSSEWSD